MLRRRVIGSVLAGAVTLAVAVLVLRDEVEPPPPAAALPTAATTGAPADLVPELPLLDRPLTWRTFGAPETDVTGQADRATVVVTAALSPTRLTVFRRGHGAGPPVSYPAQGNLQFDPTWTLHGGAVYLVGHDLTTFARQLMRLDPASGAVTPLPLRTTGVPSAYSRLVGLGDELLLVTDTDRGRATCVASVRPATGEDRVVLCVERPGQRAWLAPYGPEALVGFGTDLPGCSDWLRLQADGRLRPVRLDPAACEPWSLAVLGDWRIDAVRPLGPGTEQPVGMVTARGPDGRTVLLDAGGGNAEVCGDHVYWRAPVGPVDVLRRWRPGADHVEQVHQTAPNSHFDSPTCRDGVLAVTTNPDVPEFGRSVVQVLG